MKEALYAAFFNFAGPVTLAAFLLWGYFLWAAAKEYYPERKKRWAVSFAWALAGSLVAFLSTSVDFKVLSDETNLLSVANMLALFGKASNTEMWLYYYHSYRALDLSVPSRPILFPVLTSLVHAGVGMKPWSPFVVNFACLTGIIFLALEQGRALWRPIVWLALMMSPVLLIVSTSAGFDTCSLFFGYLTFVLLKKYAAEQKETLLRALIFSAVCFASVRYESILILPLLAAGIFWISRRLPLDLYAVAGVLVLPVFIQRYLTWGTFENPPGVPAFSFMHFRDHLLPFVNSFFLETKGPYPILLHWLGLGGLALAIMKQDKPRILLGAYAGFLFVLLLSHHFGFAHHPTQVRLFLPLSFLLIAAALKLITEFPGALDSRAVLALFALLFVHHHQYTLHDPLTTQLTMTREVRHLRDFIREEGGMGDLHVYDRPGQLTALGKSSVSPHYFREHREDLMKNLRNKLYSRIILIERVKYNGGPEEAPLVREGFRLYPLREHQLTPEERLRISRLDWF